MNTTLDPRYGIDPMANHLGCFLCPEAVEAAKDLGLLMTSFPVGFQHDEEGRYHCKLTGKTEGLLMAEIRHGTDDNALRAIVVRMFNNHPQALATPVAK